MRQPGEGDWQRLDEDDLGPDNAEVLTTSRETYVVGGDAVEGSPLVTKEIATEAVGDLTADTVTTQFPTTATGDIVLTPQDIVGKCVVCSCLLTRNIARRCAYIRCSCLVCPRHSWEFNHEYYCPSHSLIQIVARAVPLAIVLILVAVAAVRCSAG